MAGSSTTKSLPFPKNSSILTCIASHTRHIAIDHSMQDIIIRQWALALGVDHPVTYSPGVHLIIQVEVTLATLDLPTSYLLQELGHRSTPSRDSTLGAGQVL